MKDPVPCRKDSVVVMKDPVPGRKDGVGVRKYYRRSQDRNANNESGKGNQTRQMRLGYNKIVLFTLGNSFFLLFYNLYRDEEY
jgi:hypothetical protein